MRVFGWIIFAAAVLAGLACLIGVCLLFPTGRMLLFGLGAVLALFSVAVISCITGRATAEAVNFARLQFGRADLEATLRRAHRDRWNQHSFE
jgi:hypothetical protein